MQIQGGEPWPLEAALLRCRGRRTNRALAWAREDGIEGA